MNKNIIVAIFLMFGLVLVGYVFWPKNQERIVESQKVVSDKRTMTHSFTITDERGFLENMIPHHQEAVETSELILETTENSELKKFAQSVIGVQNLEIEEMKKNLKSEYGTEYVPNSNYQPMMGNLDKYSGREQERLYIEGMIFHHRGAIEMAKKALDLDLSPETRKLAENIVTSQEAEVVTLTGWLQNEYKDVQTVDPETHDVLVH